ncbi:MAG: helix-turn-helix domain-containing protein [Gemmataceae bacterium]|nr:helix-turn-helix domain-containing protein [Gemmataceae bacterium]
MNTYLTVKAVAERWGVSRSVVYQMVADGVIPSVRFGTGRGTIRLSLADVARWEEDHRRDDAKDLAEHLG